MNNTCKTYSATPSLIHIDLMLDTYEYLKDKNMCLLECYYDSYEETIINGKSELCYNIKMYLFSDLHHTKELLIQLYDYSNNNLQDQIIVDDNVMSITTWNPLKITQMIKSKEYWFDADVENPYSCGC